MPESALQATPVEDALAQLNPDALSPREALEALYQLKSWHSAANRPSLRHMGDGQKLVPADNQRSCVRLQHPFFAPCSP